MPKKMLCARAELAWLLRPTVVSQVKAQGLAHPTLILPLNFSMGVTSWFRSAELGKMGQRTWPQVEASATCPNQKP